MSALDRGWFMIGCGVTASAAASQPQPEVSIVPSGTVKQRRYLGCVLGSLRYRYACVPSESVSSEGMMRDRRRGVTAIAE